MNSSRSSDVTYDGAYDLSGLKLVVLGEMAATTLIRDVRRYDLNLADSKTKTDELIP